MPFLFGWRDLTRVQIEAAKRLPSVHVLHLETLCFSGYVMRREACPVIDRSIKWKERKDCEDVHSDPTFRSGSGTIAAGPS